MAGKWVAYIVLNDGADGMQNCIKEYASQDEVEQECSEAINRGFSANYGDRLLFFPAHRISYISVQKPD